MIKHHMIGVRIKIKTVCMEMCLRCYRASWNSFEFRLLLFDISWWMHVLFAKFVPSEPRKRFSPANACVIINILWFHFGISFQRRAKRRICSPAIIDAESAHQEFMLETAAERRKSSTIRVHTKPSEIFQKIIKNQVRKSFPIDRENFVWSIHGKKHEA